MPLYDYQCQSCQEAFEELLSMSRMEEPCSLPCPSCSELTVKQVIVGAPSIGDPMRTLGYKRVPTEFKDLMKTVKQKNPHSTMNTPG